MHCVACLEWSFFFFFYNLFRCESLYYLIPNLRRISAISSRGSLMAGVDAEEDAPRSGGSGARSEDPDCVVDDGWCDIAKGTAAGSDLEGAGTGSASYR